MSGQYFDLVAVRIKNERLPVSVVHARRRRLGTQIPRSLKYLNHVVTRCHLETDRIQPARIKRTAQARGEHQSESAFTIGTGQRTSTSPSGRLLNLAFL